MDFRSISKFEGSPLPNSPTVLTPQLEDYALFHSFRELPEIVYPRKRQPFMLVLNLANVLENELKIARVDENDSKDKDVLQVQVIHSMKELQDVGHFSRDCTFRYSLPDHLYDKPLAALWTADNHLVVVESSNLINPVQPTDVGETAVKEGRMTFIVPQKVNSVYRPTVSADVLRKSVALAQHDLLKTLKYIQHGSFVRPDGCRPEDEMEDTEPTEKDESDKLLSLQFIRECIQELERMYTILESKTPERNIIDDDVVRSFSETNIEMTKKILETVQNIERKILESQTVSI